MVRRTSTLGGLVPVQFGDDLLLHPVPLVFIQLAAFDALAAEVHVAVLAFLDTINVALVAEVAPHGPDDGKLESRVGSHRMSRERSLHWGTVKVTREKVCLLTCLDMSICRCVEECCRRDLPKHKENS